MSLYNNYDPLTQTNRGETTSFLHYTTTTVLEHLNQRLILLRAGSSLPELLFALLMTRSTFPVMR